MADLHVSWLSLPLRSPLVVGASPLGDDLDLARRLVDAGAGAIVLRSLFEEQITAEQLAAHRLLDHVTDTDAEARSFLPDTDAFTHGAQPLLTQLTRLKDAVDVPVIGSLNGVTPGGWTELARRLEAAGADAIELNLYDIATGLAERSEHVETRQEQLVREVVAAVTIPVSVKLSPFYTSVLGFIGRLEQAGAAGVVLFNRFYQPDLNLDTLDVDRRITASTPAELPLRLHALALVHGRTGLSLGASGGVHSGTDAAKAILCGAHVVQLVSALLDDGPTRLRRISGELAAWLDQRHRYRGLDEARGATALDNVANPHDWERLNYTRVLAGWRPSNDRSAP